MVNEALEKGDLSLLDNYIEVNGKWIKITDPRIKGMVVERKEEIKRLRDYFKIPFVPQTMEESLNLPKKEEEEKPEVKKTIKKEVKKTPPKEKMKTYSEEELKKLSFSKLRKIGYDFRPKIRERSTTRLVKQILKAQNAR